MTIVGESRKPLAVVWCRDVVDRQIDPPHPVSRDGIRQRQYTGKLEFMGLDERDNHLGTPLLYDREVDVQITVPIAARVLLARAQGQPNHAGDTGW